MLRSAGRRARPFAGTWDERPDPGGLGHVDRACSQTLCAPANSSLSRPKRYTASVPMRATPTPCTGFLWRRAPFRSSGDRASRQRSGCRALGARISGGCATARRRILAGTVDLIVPRSPHVGDAVTGGQDNVGLRMPSHPVARQLLAAFAGLGGSGIAAPSANRFGHVSPTAAQHVADDLGDAVAADPRRRRLRRRHRKHDHRVHRSRTGIVASRWNRSRGRRQSTGYHAARAGCGCAARTGTLASHYAPHAPVRPVAPDNLLPTLARHTFGGDRVAVLARTVIQPRDFAGAWIAAPLVAPRYAHDLYANLRALDAPGVTAILIESVPNDDDMAGGARPACAGSELIFTISRRFARDPVAGP